MESLYREMMEMREHLLRRIELLEDDVERLSEENYEYAREIYTLEKKINSLSKDLSSIMEFIEKLNELNTDKTVPLASIINASFLFCVFNPGYNYSFI